MNITTQLLGLVGASVENANPEPGDTLLQVPNTLLANVELVRPVFYGLSLGAGSGLGLAVQVDSHLIGYFAERAAGAAAITDRWVNLGPGLWELAFNISYLCPAAATRLQMYMQLSTPSGSGGGASYLVNVNAPGNLINVTAYSQFKVAVPKGCSFQIDAATNNTLGASTLCLSAGGIANKLV